MSVVTKSRTSNKPARETHGTCYLKATGNLTLQQALDSGDALLSLHTDDGCTNYLVQRLTDPEGETVGYRMMKLTDFIVDRQVYDIDISSGFGWICDCADCQFRNRECKHIRSLRAALTQNGITLPAPKRQQPTEEDCRCFECGCPITPRQMYCDKHNGI
jgi:hypothetical protein